MFFHIFTEPVIRKKNNGLAGTNGGNSKSSIWNGMILVSRSPVRVLSRSYPYPCRLRWWIKSRSYL
ncbi:hypothetical protein Avbf_10452 [Armadillidium vulgare]|nr:hypothetical protein Avbf_10452 [Armadillidium vulgare]